MSQSKRTVLVGVEVVDDAPVHGPPEGGAHHAGVVLPVLGAVHDDKVGQLGADLQVEVLAHRVVGRRLVALPLVHRTDGHLGGVPVARGDKVERHVHHIIESFAPVESTASRSEVLDAHDVEDVEEHLERRVSNSVVREQEDRCGPSCRRRPPILSDRESGCSGPRRGCCRRRPVRPC